MPFEIAFVWKDKEYRAIASRKWTNGVPSWLVTFPSGKGYEFLWNNGHWMHCEHYTRQMPPELKNTICRAIENHPEYQKEMHT